MDKRADIWAFGTVLYEMLTGRKAFEGETVSDTLAAVLTKEPNWSALPAETPVSVRRVLRRCLGRDPKTRIHDVADARLELDEQLARTAERGTREGPRPALGDVRRPRPRHRRAAAGWWQALEPLADPPARVTGFAVALPERDRIPSMIRPFSISRGTGPGSSSSANSTAGACSTCARETELSLKPVPGSEGAYGPFFSPDGQWIGFFADGKLKKIPSAGGVAMSLADAPEQPRRSLAG